MVSYGLIALYAGLLLSNSVQSGAAGKTPDWHKFARSPVSNIVKPIGIVSSSTTGNVSNPSGLIGGHKRDGSPTVLTRQTTSDGIPTIVADFGKNVVGILNLQFTGAQSFSTGLPGLRLAFSETMQYLTDRSDFTRSDNASGVSLKK